MLCAALLLAAAGVPAHACRPMHWSTQDIAEAGDTIALAKITAHDGKTITLAVLKPCTRFHISEIDTAFPRTF